MKKILLILVLLGAACSGLSTQHAEFVAYNTSNDAVEFRVADGVGYKVAANDSGRFVADIEVPRDRRYYSGSSIADKTVSVSVAVKNLVTGHLLEPRMCQSGVKVIVTLTYSKKNGNETLNCTSSY